MSDFRTSHENVELFREAMAEVGAHYVGEIIGDGQLHRFYVEGDRRGSRNGWYVYHDDEKPSGAFGYMKNGEHSTTWTAKGSRPLTREERAAYAAKREDDRRRRAAAERERIEAAAKRAQEMWDAATPAEEHSYLTRKGVASHGLRIGNWVKERRDGSTYIAARGALLIPIRDETKRIYGLQAIFEKPITMGEVLRDKDFVQGARKRGCWWTIGQPTKVGDELVVCVCEGYATGASVHAATGLGVVVAFDAGNLQPVAETVRRLMPEAKIVILADDDRWTVVNEKPVNVGVIKANEAAAAVGGIAIAPRFADLSEKPSDWNDLEALEGGGEVRRQVLEALEPRSDAPEPAGEPAPDPDEPPPWSDDDIPPNAAEFVDPDDNGQGPPEAEEDDKDTDGYFRVLGHDREHIYVYQYKLKLIIVRKMADWSEAALLTLAPIQWWEREFPGSKGGLDKKAAHNWLMRRAEAKGYFDPNCRRGRGAWRDDGRIVIHFGDRLMIDGVLGRDLKIASGNVYEQARRLRPPADVPLSSVDGKRIVELARLFAWSRQASAILWAGWCALAPLGGALSWRPHVWVTGGAGSGKTTILQVAHWLLNGSAIYAQGNSTEAGIRQTLKMDSLPVIFDESEQNNDREAMRVQSILAMVRQSSSETDAKTFKGTQGGDSMDFHIRSMFHLSSIQVGMKQQADFERVSVLTLRPKREGAEATESAAENWRNLKAAINELKADPELPARLLRRSVELLPTTLANIETFSQAAAESFGSQREGDQYGTLLAGAWSLISTRLASIDEARAMIKRYDWSDYLENSDSEESSKALGALMESKIRVKSGVEVSTYELVAAAAKRPVETCEVGHKEADALLRRHGMIVRFTSRQERADEAILLVSYNSTGLARLVADTPYAADLKGQLLRTPGAARHGVESFNGRKDRCTSLPLSQVLDGLVEAQLELPDSLDAFDDRVAF